MGLLNSALQIGRSAILSYQGALEVVGNNISSAGSPDYIRLSPDLDPFPGTLQRSGLQPGAGVTLNGISRNIDEALEGRLRLAIGGSGSAVMRHSSLAQIEALFDDLSGTGAGSRLVEFLHGFDDVQNAPTDLGTRDLAISRGAFLAETIRALRGQLANLGEGFDGQIPRLVAQADEWAQQIARLNERITTSEAGTRGQATALRDQRDALLRELGELFDVTVREQPNGAINVYIGSEALVQGSIARRLVAVAETAGGFVRTSVRFADTNAQIGIRGGQLDGIIDIRDHQAYGRIGVLDELAAALIQEVNRLHADGQGLDEFQSVTGTYSVLDSEAMLNDVNAGLAFPPQSGSFYITVRDRTTGTPLAYRIDIDLDGVDDDTTLTTLVEDINATVSGVAASITSDNRLALAADDGFTFTFGHDGQQQREDTSHVLAALGINTFFRGTSARDLAVNESLVGQPRLLAASRSALVGDGSNAGRLAALDSDKSALLGGVSLTDFYNSIVSSVAVETAAARDTAEVADAVLFSLRTQKESVSGVNLDEEAIALLKYQRAFQGASRFVRVVDSLLDELILLIR